MSFMRPGPAASGLVDFLVQAVPARAQALARTHPAPADRSGHKWRVFRHVDVFERDRWICGICNKKVDILLSYPHPMSKSLDHIVPLSKGGAHSFENCQTAHLRCNLLKRDS